MNTVKKNITQPADWWAAFSQQAQSEGMNLSHWVGECCKGYLKREVVKRLTDRPAPHRPRKVDKPQT